MFDSEKIKGLAVKAVTGFVTDGTSLNDGIAKIASEENLNPEQIKRVVEASNTIAHLKLLESSKDRTFEFPVAKYESVLGKMVMPEGYTPTPTQLAKEQDIDSAASRGDAKNENIKYASSREELETYVARSLIAVKTNLEKLAYDKQEKLLEIEDSIKKLQKAEFPMEKLAEVAEEEDFNLVFGIEKSASLNDKLVFTDRDLAEARRLVGLLKEAREIIKEEHEKQAWVAAAAGTLGKALGSLVGVPTRWLAGKGANIVTNTAKGVTAKLTKQPIPGASKTLWESTKKNANRGLMLGGAALTPHAGGSVWDQLQK